ncbi:MAG: CYTH domain-containing protein [Candidatus Taylorbacteria bacterium]|nr:CYTH domain-containing protein [Candidatus Taylorbacteria bacterium]
MSRTYEVEIKSLLGSKENADSLKKGFMKMYPTAKLVGEEKQLNHYFNAPSEFATLKTNLLKVLPEDKKESLEYILTQGKKLSIRTRDANGKVLVVIKASVGDDSSSNGVKRIEFEAVVTMTLGELDDLLLASGCSYQAKWSREREEYEAGDMHMCLDKNAGYGYLAEFEKVTNDEASLDRVRDELLAVMKSLDVVELAQDRLERMFAHYNAHWAEYYGTDKTFNIE